MSLLTFATALDLAGLDSTSYLNDDGSGLLTALAPTDDAFELINGKFLEAEWRKYLIAMLEYHLLAGRFPATSLNQNLTLPTQFTGKEVSVTEDDPIIFNNNAMVVDGNLDTSNGLVHVVNNVLLPPTAGISLLDQAFANPEISMFVELVTSMGLTDALAGEGPWTLLIPTNDAFAKIPSTIFNQLDDNALTQIALFHVLPEIQLAYQLASEITVMTMHGTSLQLSGTGVVGEANFTPNKDVLASNGVWHTIDTLLLPVVSPEPTDGTIDSPPTSSPVAALPSAPPFDIMPTNVPVTVQTDAPATTVPFDMPSDAPVAAPTAAAPVDVPTVAPSDILTPAQATIFQVAAGVGALSEFVEALVLADLVEALNGPGPFTVWAPTNGAFSGMPLKIYEPAWKLHLGALLAYHVVPNQKVLTTNLTVGDKMLTAEGTDIVVTKVSPLIFNNHAHLITSDVLTSNGILHAINNLLLPPYVTRNVAQITASEEDLTELTMHLQHTGLMAYLDTEGPFTLLAPVNSAFQKVPVGAILGSLDDEGREDVLTYHVIPALINSEQLTDGATFETLQGAKVQIMNVGVTGNSEIRINEATIIETDILANNGIIHYLDTVLIPNLSTDYTPAKTPLTDTPTVAPITSTISPVSTATLTLAPSSNTTDVPPKAPVASTLAPVAATMVPTTALNNDTIPPTVAVTPVGSETLMTIAEIVNANEQFTVLATAVNATGLFSALDSPQSILTMFAPTDAAFISSPLNLTQYLEPQWKAHLSSILTYHLLPGTKVASSQLTENTTVSTLEGTRLTVNADSGKVTINGIPIETADLDASNGVVHVVTEQALLPPSAVNDIVQIASITPELSTVVELLQQSELDLSQDGPFTFFAPSNSFLDALPSGMFDTLGTAGLTEVLGFHVVSNRIYLEDDLFPGMVMTTLQGSDIVIGSSNTSFNIVNSNFLGSNGIIHEIDNLLIPYEDEPGGGSTPSQTPTVTSAPSIVLVPTTEEPSAAPLALLRVSDLLSTETQFSALLQLLEASGVVATFETNGPFTVFAPNDDAFGDVPPFILATLTGESLVQTLSYHVVSGVFTSSDLVDRMVLPTLQGGNITVSNTAMGAFLTDDSGNTVQVVLADYTGSNGVVHEIDGVMFPVLSTSIPTAQALPSSTEVPDTAVPTTNLPTTVLVLPTTDNAPSHGAPTSAPSVVQIIEDVDSLSNLTALIDQSDLDVALSTPGPFTVFAPIDDGFQALPYGFLASQSPDQITNILTYHVVPGTYLLSDFAGASVELQTLSGSNLSTSSILSQLIRGESFVASNGVVHLVSQVLFAPPLLL